MKINAEIIKKFEPCEPRFNNFKKEYPKFEGNLKEFISLDRISYRDKIWVVTRLFTKKQNVQWAVLCAESVLSIYESKYPNDNRPRAAIDAIKAWMNNPSEENRLAAYAAAGAAADAAYAAYAADYAAARATNAAADYAAGAATNAARAAAGAANAAAYDFDKQIELNLKLILKVTI